jgi:predicted transcriptional regulator
MAQQANAFKLPPEALDDKDHFARIVAAYVSNNKVSPAELPQLMQQVREFLSSIPAKNSPTAPIPLAKPTEPAVPITESVKPDYLICLEDGVKCKTLRRYLKSRYGLSPEQYRRRWNLPEDYPMVAPSVSESRSIAAKNMQLGGAKARRKTG